MAKKYIIWILVGFILFFLAANVHAFDGQRQGFILGFGLGPGFTSYTEEFTLEFMGLKSSVERDRQNKLGVMSDFKIGYAPNNSLEIYYTNKVSWFGHKYSQRVEVWDSVYAEYIEKWTIATGLTAAGVTYYFYPTAPSWFLSGGLGVSAWLVPFEENGPDPRIGLGLFVGGGYEFTRHVNVEVNLCWGKPKDTEGGVEISSNALTVSFTVNALAY